MKQANIFRDPFPRLLIGCYSEIHGGLFDATEMAWRFLFTASPYSKYPGLGLMPAATEAGARHALTHGDHSHLHAAHSPAFLLGPCMPHCFHLLSTIYATQWLPGNEWMSILRILLTKGIWEGTIKTGQSFTRKNRWFFVKKLLF